MTPRLPRLKLSARMAIAIVLAVSASFLLDQSLRTLIPPPPFLVVQHSWLIETIARDLRAPTPSPQTAPFLDIAILPKPPFFQGGEAHTFANKLRDDLRNVLNVGDADIHLRADYFSDNLWERSTSTSAVVIPTLPSMLSASDLASSRTSVLGRLEIAVRRPDGRWLVLSPRRTSDARWHLARNLLGILGNLLILTIFSVWMARSIVQPLGRLATAAERLGRDREPTLITGMRHPEFVAIADTFNAMQLRLKRYIDQRVQMLAAISHDLRTPLTRLRLLAEYVQDGEQRTQLKSNVAEMETMVADALAFMRNEARHEPVETVDLAALLISLADIRKDMGEDVIYSGPDHLDIRCRPVAMRRALDNLIANGCRYGEAVRIALSVLGEAVVIDVSDRGPGIPPEDAERAFTPFVRLDSSRSRETGGTGLGLAISRDVIRSHGGEIGFHRGDTFTVRVTLPEAFDRMGSAPETAQARSTLRPA